MKLFQSLIDYLRSSKSELEKVSWPSRQETVRYSLLVISASVVLAVFFATLDFGLGKLVDVALLSGQQPAQTQQPIPPDIELNTTTTNPQGLDFSADPGQTFTP